MDFKNYTYDEELETPKFIKKMKTETKKDNYKIFSEKMRKESRKVKYVDYALSTYEESEYD